jgi:hypothetical protein
LQSSRLAAESLTEVIQQDYFRLPTAVASRELASPLGSDTNEKKDQRLGTEAACIFSIACRVRQTKGLLAASKPEIDSARVPEVILGRIVELVSEAGHQVIDLHRPNFEGSIYRNVEAAAYRQGESISCR